MILDITNITNSNISYRIVKGEIQSLRPNPWIRGFLMYIQEHPQANEQDICRELFCDNGKARLSAVKNILFFYKQSGLICYDKINGYELTQEGLKAFESCEIWQGLKGAFAVTLWTPDSGFAPFLLNIQPVPDHWYDKGSHEIVDMSETYGKNMQNVELCSDKVKLVEIGKMMRQTYIKTDFKAKLNPINGDVTIKGTPDTKSNLKSYDVHFKLGKEMLESLCADNEDEDDAA